MHSTGPLAGRPTVVPFTDTGDFHSIDADIVNAGCSVLPHALPRSLASPMPATLLHCLRCRLAAAAAVLLGSPLHGACKSGTLA